MCARWPKPLILQGKCIGVLDIQSRHVDYFTPEQQNILTLLAGRLATAIENARLYQKERTQAETLLLLNEVGRETSSILDVEELLRRAAEQIKRVIDYQILSLMLYDEKQKVFRHRIDVKTGTTCRENCAWQSARALWARPRREGAGARAGRVRRPALSDGAIRKRGRNWRFP